MKKITLTAALSIFIIKLLLAQAPDTLWTKTYGGLDWEIAYDIQLTSDGGYIIAGKTNSFGAGGNDMYLIKTDANGDTLWTRTYGGTESESAKSVFQTSDGGYVLAGKVGGSNGDIYVVKTDSLGDTLWTRTIGNGANEDCNSVIQTVGDDYYIILGETKSYGPGNYSVYFIEISPAADTIWEDYFGGPAHDFGRQVIEVSNGYVFIASTNNFGAGGSDAWIVKIDWDYNIIWSTTIGGGQSDDGYAIQQTSDGGFIGAGRTSSFGPGDNSYFIFKLNSVGDSLWAKVFGGTERDDCYSVSQTADGGYILAGHTHSFGVGNYWDWYIVRTDANGDSLWTKTYGGSHDDECFAIKPTSDGGYIIAGSTLSFGAGNSDVWLVKLAPDPAGISEKNKISDFVLYQNYPNPFNENTIIEFDMQKSSFTELNIYDILGKKMHNLINEILPPGKMKVELNAKDFPPGIYLYQLVVDGNSVTKMMVVK